MSHPALPSAPAQFIVLHSRRSSVVLEHHADEAPIWRYWGPRLPEGAGPGFALREGRPLPSFMLDVDQPLTVAPPFGVGWFGQSALLAHRAGQQFAQAFTACTVQWIDPGRTLVLHLVDSVAQLALDLRLSLDEASDVLTLQSTLHNHGATPLDETRQYRLGQGDTILHQHLCQIQVRPLPKRHRQRIDSIVGTLG